MIKEYIMTFTFLDEDTPLSRRNARVARFKFDEIAEAYQTLMDINQRHFYDQHGFAADALRYSIKKWSINW